MTFSGTASLNNREIGYDILQAINSYTTCKIDIIDRTWTNIATLKANALKSVIKTHSIYSNIILRGELRNMSITTERVTYNVLDKARKLLNQPANYNPIKLAGYFRNLLYSSSLTTFYIDDVDLNFTSSVAIGDMIHFQRSNAKNLRLTVNRVYAAGDIIKYANGASDGLKLDAGAPSVNTTESGDLDRLYYSEDGEYSFYTDAGNFEDTMIRLDVYFALRSSVSISEIDMEAVLQTRPLARFSAIDNNDDDPVIGIYDPIATEFEVSYIRGSDVGGRYVKQTSPKSGLTVTPKFSKKVTDGNIGDLSGNPSKYLQTVSSEGDVTLYKITFCIGMGQDALDRKELILWAFIVNLKLDSDQQPELGVSTVSNVATNVITFNDTLGTEGRPPLYDGVGLNDIYLFTDTLDDQITALATAWSITINTNITNDSTYALTSDLTYATRQEVLQQICDMTNSYWYYDPSADTYEIVSADNIASTGITITKNDIHNYNVPGSWTYEIDADNIRDTLTVKADDKTGAVSISLTPEFSHTLGNEEVIIKRPNIHSKHQATKLANAEKYKYEKTRRKITFTLDFDNPNQSYTNLTIGKSIAVQIPDASDSSVANHTSGNDGELLVTQLQWARKAGINHRRLVTVTAEARYS